nr:hypothetical protein [Candidatus Sigynarchaeota archaeon]
MVFSSNRIIVDIKCNRFFLHPDEKHVYINPKNFSFHPIIQVYDIEKRQMTKQEIAIPNASNDVDHFIISPDGTQIAFITEESPSSLSVSWSGNGSPFYKCSLLNLNDQTTTSIKGDRCYDLKFHPSGEFLLLQYDHKKFQIYNIPRKEMVKTIRNDEESVVKYEISPDGLWILFATQKYGYNKRVVFTKWRFSPSEKKYSIKGESHIDLSYLTILKDGKRFLVAYNDSYQISYEFRSLEDGGLIAGGKAKYKASFPSFGITPDEKYLMIWNQDKSQLIFIDIYGDKGKIHFTEFYKTEFISFFANSTKMIHQYKEELQIIDF